MGKPTGFLEYERVNGPVIETSKRVGNFNEFHGALKIEEQRKQAARCMECGVPFCQAGTMIAGIAYDRVGGLLRYGIPNMKLDKSIIDRRVEIMKASGIEFICNVNVGKDIPADLVLIAAGFLGCEGYVADTFGVECNERTNVKTAQGAHETTVERVFTAGDMHRGQSLVVWAIAEGRAAAKAVDESLMGYTNL